MTTSTPVVVTNDTFSPTSAITTVRDASGIVARFPYDPSDVASVTRRYVDFASFSTARNFDVVDVIGDVVAAASSTGCRICRYTDPAPTAPHPKERR